MIATTIVVFLAILIISNLKLQLLSQKAAVEDLRLQHKKELETLRGISEQRMRDYQLMLRRWKELKSNCEHMRNHMVVLLIERTLEKMYQQAPEYREKIWYKVGLKGEPGNTISSVTIGINQDKVELDFDDQFNDQLLEALKRLIQNH